MIQRGEDFCFAVEAREAFRVAGQRIGKNFDGDLALQLQVAGAIHFAHPAGAERGEDLITTELVACGERHMSLSLLDYSARFIFWSNPGHPGDLRNTF